MTAAADVIEPPAFALRRGEPSDQGYITSTWLNSLRRSPALRNVKPQSFFAGFGADVDALLDRGDVGIVVAAHAADKNAIIGWCCYTPMPPATLVVHYIYVRAPQRCAGVGRALLDAASDGLAPQRALVYTFKGPDEKSLVAKFNASYVPVGRFLR